MPKTCIEPNCERRCFGGGYCRSHQYKRGKTYRIKPYSKKRRVVNEQYNQRARKFRNEHPKCTVLSPVCTGNTQGVHHVKGRGRYLMDENYWKPACNACNTYIEDHPVWARENGHKESKFTPPAL